MRKRSLYFILPLVIIFAASGYYFIKRATKNTEPQAEVVVAEQTKPVVEKTYTLAAVGDIACTPGGEQAATSCQMDAVVSAIKLANPDKILVLGDLQYDKGTIEEFTSVFQPLWVDFKSKSHAVPGNHEYATENAKGYFNYWNGIEVTSAQAGDYGKGYYSFNYGNWHIIALNSNCKYIGGCDELSPQGIWLEKDLRKHKNRCSLAFWHHPPYSSGKYADKETELAKGRDLWQAASASGVEIVLNGHDHIYERFAPRLAGGEVDDRGTRQFIIGTGGRVQYPLTLNHPSSEYRQSDNFGFLMLTLKFKSYEWKYVTTENQVLDSGSAQCY